MIWRDNQYCKGSIITKLKEIFNFGPEEMEAFTYIGTGLKQKSDFSVKIYVLIISHTYFRVNPYSIVL